MGRVDPDEYRALVLDVHAFLGDTPLHDVWSVDLPGHHERTLEDLSPLFSFERVTQLNAAVRFLFRLRGLLGRLFGWDRAGAEGGDPFLHR